MSLKNLLILLLSVFLITPAHAVEKTVKKVKKTMKRAGHTKPVPAELADDDDNWVARTESVAAKARDRRMPDTDNVVKELQQMRESELTLVEQIADQLAELRLHQGQVDDQMEDMRADLDRVKRSTAGHHDHVNHSATGPHADAPSWWESLSFQIPIVVLALGVFASGPFLEGM